MTMDWNTILPTGPFDLASTMECGQAFRWRQASTPEMGDHFEGVIFGNLVRAKQTDSEVLFTSEPNPPSSFRPIFEDYLGLNHDLDSIYDELSEDPVLARLFEKYPGLRILRQDPWECLVSFICSANNNIARISQNVESLASTFGNRIDIGGEGRWAFPPSAALSAAGEQALRDLRLGYKAKYVAGTANHVVEGKVDLFALREEAYGPALDAVTGLPGVADKIGNCVLLFSLDKLEAFPVDVHIERAVEREYAPRFDGKPMTKKRMREWAQQYFGPHAGYANQYLFYDDLLEGRQS
jgi:N-glycosylase/DNA lyase